MSIRALVLVLALLVTAGCSSSAPTARSRADTGDPLGALIIDAAPAGFAVRAESGSHTGPTDLAKAIRDDAQPDARAALTAARFVRGYQRLWTNSAGDVLAIQVYRFATVGGAGGYLRRARTLAAHQAQHVVTYAVPGIDAAHGSGTEVDVEGDVTEQVSAARGPLVLELLCSSRDGLGLRARARRLAGAQYRRLVRSPQEPGSPTQSR